MQDGKHGAISRRIQKLVRMPTGGERTRFRFAIAYHARDEQVRIIERRAVRMRQRVAKFAAFMNGARRFRCNVTRNSARKRKLFEEPLQSVFRLWNLTIDFAV